MMEIKRESYLRQLIDRQWNGQIKVITGIRRCGKSYLLRTLFRNYLLAHGVREEEIISLELDLVQNVRYRNPLELAKFVHERVDGKKARFYLFLDEIQMCEAVKNPYLPDGKKITFSDVLNEFREMPNLDVYVTGSNSKMLSSDVLTEFRGRGDELRLHPLSFAEFFSATGGDAAAAWEQYAFFGGMPMLLSRRDDGAKMAYLDALFSEVYFKDITERHKVEYPEELSQVLDLLSSSVGSLTNPANIANTIRSRKKVSVSANTLKQYMGYLLDAFLFSECKRFDVRGKAYFDFPVKYYCEDVGLRNARTGFRQMELTHIMENVIANELRIRNFSVDVGVVYEKSKNASGNFVLRQREIDFIATKGSRKIYVQSAFAMPDEKKRQAELTPFALTGDSFPKIAVRQDVSKSWFDEYGTLHVGLMEFLLNPSITD